MYGNRPTGGVLQIKAPIAKRTSALSVSAELTAPREGAATRRPLTDVCLA
jgi:hypothetical protein